MIPFWNDNDDDCSVHGLQMKYLNFAVKYWNKSFGQILQIHEIYSTLLEKKYVAFWDYLNQPRLYQAYNLVENFYKNFARYF